jgi:hypothetical protein
LTDKTTGDGARGKRALSLSSPHLSVFASLLPTRVNYKTPWIEMRE